MRHLPGSIFKSVKVLGFFCFCFLKHPARETIFDEAEGNVEKGEDEWDDRKEELQAFLAAHQRTW